VVAQFAVLIGLVIVAITIARQTLFALNEGMRVDKDQVVLMASQPCIEPLRDEAAKLPERVAELEAERESLMARIAELEDELSELSGLTQEVEGRLDGAIGEIRAVLAR